MTHYDPTPEKLRQIVVTDAHVEMKCRGPMSFLHESGYVGKVFDNAFEFLRITNSNEYYRNENIAPPEVERHIVKFKDIIWIDIDDPPVEI